MKKNEEKYAIQLAQNEIDIEPKRLGAHKTYFIYHGRERIGYVSFRFKSDKTIYLYILAFKKHAQRQGYGSIVIESIMNYGQKKDDDFRGLTAKIHRINDSAVGAARKYGFLVTNSSKKYINLMKPISYEREISHAGNCSCL